MADDDQKQKKGFFRNLKMSFKNRKGKHFKGDDLGRFNEHQVSGETCGSYGIGRLERGLSDENGIRNGG